MTTHIANPSARRAASAALLTLMFAAKDVAHPLAGTCLSEATFSKRLEFASIDSASKALARPDAWARQLSAFDRGARMRTLAPTSTQQFLQFASGAAVEGTPAELTDWAAVAEQIGRAVEGLNVKLPRILLVKTDGREESDAAYTRARSIFLPERFISLPVTDPRRAFFLLAHELFHVLSRANPAQRDALYALLGFERVAGFEYPAELEGRRLSNPDAFEYEHAVSVQTAAGAATVVPVIQATAPLEEVIQLPSFFAALDIMLLAVDADTGEIRHDTGGNLITYGFGNTDWPARMLRNSSFIIHPEEILADNFATLMEKRATGVLSPANPNGFPVNDPDLLFDIERTLTVGCHGESAGR